MNVGRAGDGADRWQARSPRTFRWFGWTYDGWSDPRLRFDVEQQLRAGRAMWLVPVLSLPIFVAVFAASAVAEFAR